MGSNTKYVEFTFNWTHRWADFDQIARGLSVPRHYFITSFKNVSFKWYAKMYAVKDEPTVGFCVKYEEGPLDKISGVECGITGVRGDQSLHTIRPLSIHKYQRSGPSWGWPAFEDKDPSAVRTKYRLSGSDRLTYQITIRIPTKMFAYSLSSPVPAPCSPWLVNLFDSINDDGNPWPPETKVAGRDGVVLKCHRGIVVVQSKTLETIFQYPPTQKESGKAAAGNQPSVPNPKKRKASAMDDDTTATERADCVYKFPNLCAASLKSVLEYVYTGMVTTSTLTVTELIEMGDAGEQYNMKTLKEFAAAELWKRAVVEEPTYAFDIARFAYLHDELKYLKHRALDIISENYDRLGVLPNELVERFGKTRGEELRDELMEHMGRRLRPIINE